MTTNLSRYKKRLTYLKNRVNTNQKHTIDSQKKKKKRREHRHNTKESHQTTKVKINKRDEEETQNQQENKVENGNKYYISINNYLKCQWTKWTNQKTKRGRLD